MSQNTLYTTTGKAMVREHQRVTLVNIIFTPVMVIDSQYKKSERGNKMLEVFFITLNLQSVTYPVNVTPYGFTLHFHNTPYFFPFSTRRIRCFACNPSVSGHSVASLPRSDFSLSTSLPLNSLFS